MADPYFPIYPGDYLRDTRGLSLDEHGAYFLLLMNYYAEEGIPSDKDRLYRTCGALTPKDQAAVDHIVGKYFPIIKGRFTNKRADEEIEKRKRYIEMQTRKSALAVEFRKKPADTPADIPVGHPRDDPGACISSPSPSLSLDPSSKDQSQSRVIRPGNGRFTLPTIEQVSEYCKARNNHVDPVKFHAHYTANGWRVGKNPMKNWKAAVVTWERSVI